MAAFNNPRFFAAMLESLEYFHKNPRISRTYIRVDDYSIPITKKGAIKLLHSRISWIKGKPLETDQDYEALFKILHDRIFVKGNHKKMVQEVTREITGLTLDSTPTFEQTDPELHQLSYLPENEQHSAFENWVKKNTDQDDHKSSSLSSVDKKLVEDKLQNPEHQGGTIKEPTVDYQSPLNQPATNPQTGRRWLTEETLPKVGRAAQRVTQSPIFQDALVETEIVAKTQAQPWVFRTVKSFGRTVLDEIPIFSSSRPEYYSPPRGGRNLARSGFSAARKGTSAIRTGAMLARAAPAAANPVFAIIIAVIAVVILLFFLMMQNGIQNNTLCGLPGDTCGSAILGTDSILGAPASSLIITKDGPPGGAVANGNPISYTINITYKGVGTAKVDVTDKIPADTKFASANPNDGGVFERKNPDTLQETLVWHLDDIKTNQTKQVTFTVDPQKPDFWAVNQASASVTGITGVSGQGLLCVADVDPRLIPYFEQSAVAANLPPALMYAISKGEHHGAPISAISLDNKPPLISPCGAHGIMQIQHPNDGTGRNYGASCAAIGGTSSPPESWNPLVQSYNGITGGKLNNVDTDEDNIWGSSFFVRYFKVNNLAFKDKGYLDQFSDADIVAVSVAYLGAYNAGYANFYLNAYHQAIASQGTCGGAKPASAKTLTP